MSELLLIVRRSWNKYGNASTVAADLGISEDSLWSLLNDIDTIENAGV